MIFTDRTITVRKGESRIDEPIVVYRGDYELEVRFTILNSKFRFMSGTNLIESEKASYGQLAILTPYGGNIFSDIVRCNDGSVTFILTAEMLNQIEEVGLYSFQIRLMDYVKESRVSIPPVEYGIEVREPIASEDHDNSVNNAIVGYSIAKVVDPKEENVGDTFDKSGNYNKTKWETGDRISEGKLNKIEGAIDTINRNEVNNTATLSKRIDNNFNVLDATKADKNEIFTMANMGQDVKEAMTGGSVAVVGENAVMTNNILDKQITNAKIADNSVDGRLIPSCALKWCSAAAHMDFLYDSNSYSGNIYALITIKNTIGNISTGSTIRLMCNVKNYTNNEMTVKGMGIGSTEYPDDRDYNKIPEVDNFESSYVVVNKNAGEILSGVGKIETYPYEITSNTPYIILGVIFPIDEYGYYDFDVFNLYIKVDDREIYGDDIQIVNAGIYRHTEYITGLNIECGNPIKISDQLLNNDLIIDNMIMDKVVNRGMLYGIDDFMYLKATSTNDEVKWPLITIPNVINGYNKGDAISIKVSCVDISGRYGYIFAGLAGAMSNNGIEYYTDGIYSYTSGNSDNITLKGIKTTHTISFVMEDDMYDSDTDYLVVGLTQAINATGLSCECILFDLAISKNGSEFISIDIESIVNYGVYSPGGGGLTSDSIFIRSKGFADIMKTLDNSAIGMKEISPSIIDPLVNRVWDISVDINSDKSAPWLIGIIDKKNIVIENDSLNFRWEITSDELTILPVLPDTLTISTWCLGYTEFLDSSEFNSVIPGYVSYSAGYVYYDGTYLIGSIPIKLLPEPQDGKENLCIGVRIAKVVNDKIATGSNMQIKCRNSGVINPFSHMDLYKHSFVSTSIKATSLSDNYILTTDNFSELININIDNEVVSNGYLSIIGDSISTFDGWIPSGNKVFYDGSKYGITDVTKTWWYMAMTELGMNLCVNNSWSGSRVTTTAGDESAACMSRCQNLHTEEHEPDFIIIYIGINDYNNGVDIGVYDGRSSIPESTTTFREAYSVMLDKVLTRYPRAKVFVATLPYCDRNDDENSFPELNRNGVPLSDFNDAIRELANAFGVEIIELSKCGITFHNRKIYLGDELHPNTAGMELMSRKVINKLRNS